MATMSKRTTRYRVSSLTDPIGVLIVNGVALAVVLLHVLIDYHIGLYGASSEIMTPAQAANALRIAVTASGWMIALGVSMRGSRTGTACALAFVVVWGFTFNGLVAFLVVPPPSAAFPYQDIAHVGGIVFGGLAAYVLWRRMRRLEGTLDRRYLFVALGWLLIIAPILGFFASPVAG